MRVSKGVTLLEALLVLAIGAAILLLGIRQYQVYRVDADIQQLRANVDYIFQSMAAFYQANCSLRYNPNNNNFTPYRLNPGANPTNPFPLNITEDLIDAGFLTATLPISPLVDTSGPGTDGYVAQLNGLVTGQNRLVCVTGSSANNTISPPQCTATRPIGVKVVWMLQVAVQILDKDNAEQYKNLLGADCLSSVSGNVIAPCTANSTGDYAVWQRAPSFATTNYTREGWLANPLVSQFTQMYTTYPSGYLIQSGGRMPNNNTQYFFCGGG